MPVARLEDHRIRAGIQTVANVTSTYAVKNIALVADQAPFETPWIIASRSSIPLRRARYSDSADSGVIADGYWIFEWVISYMTFGMVSYWNTTFYPSSVEYADVTVMTYDQNNTAVFLTCKGRRLNFPRDGANWPGGYRDVRMQFEEGNVIT
jgi:hypothetical protein